MAVTVEERDSNVEIFAERGASTFLKFFLTTDPTMKIWYHHDKPISMARIQISHGRGLKCKNKFTSRQTYQR